MEGFDKAFLTAFFAFPAFQEHFGSLQAKTGEYEIPASIQAGITNGVNAGQIIGLLVNGWLADRFGYRKVMLGCLFLMVCFIFLQFFATSIYMYMGAGVLLGVPWGVFQTLVSLSLIPISGCRALNYGTDYYIRFRGHSQCSPTIPHLSRIYVLEYWLSHWNGRLARIS